MNQEIFLSINSFRSPAIDALMNFGTELGNFWNIPWLVIFLVASLLAQTKFRRLPFLLSREKLIELISALVIGYIVTGLIVAALKFGLHMPRPSVIYGPHVMHSVELPDSPFSLPSGHSAFAMLVTATLWRFSSITFRFALAVFVLWVGVSRINLGMHFPLDVILGYIAGLFGVWCAYRVLTWRSKGRALSWRF